MPMIRSRLEQIFSIDRLEVSAKGDRIISEGCAWIAHDNLQMALAKPIEIAEARGAYLPIFRSGTRLPIEGDAITNQVGLYCVDPRDRIDERLPYDLLTVKVDHKAKSFLERINVDFVIDDNFIVTATASSSLIGDKSSCEIIDLEFSLALPEVNGTPLPFEEGPESYDSGPETGIVISRENVIREYVDMYGKSKIMPHHLAAVPGEYLYTYSPRSFDPENGNATKLQEDEKLYYQPFCKKRFNDPNCRCSQVAYQLK